MALPAIAPAFAIFAGVASGVFCDQGPGAGTAPAIWLGWILAGVCAAQRRPGLFAGTALAAFALCGWGLAAAAAKDAAAPPLRALLAGHIGGDEPGGGSADTVWVTGRLVHDVLHDPDGLRFALDVEHIRLGSTTRPAEGRVFLSVSGVPAPGATDGWRQGRRIRAPASLRRPTRYRNPGVPDGERAYARRGVALVGSVKSAVLVDVVARASWPGEAAIWVRGWSRRALDEHVGRRDPRSAAVARAVLLGDRAGLDRETTERLQQAGTFHVIAISGGNIAILTALLIWSLRMMRVPSPVAELVASSVLAAYAWFVGGGASVVRATLMAVTYLTGRAFDHRSPPTNTVAVAGAILLVADPMSMFDPGAWLSFGATVGILHGVSGVLPRLGLRRSASRAIAGLFLASLSAELALFPVSAFAFSRVTAAGLLVNFAAVPLMSVVQICGMATLGASLVGRLPGQVGGEVTHLAAWGLVESARFVDLAPWLTLRLPAPGWITLAAYYVGLVVAASYALKGKSAGDAWRSGRGLRPSRTVAWAAGLLAAASAIWMLTAPHGGRVAPDRVRVTWIDVGQGDAVLVELPGGRTLLTDAGGAGGLSPDIGRRVVAPVVWARGVGRLDYLAVSHVDADHAIGAPMLIRDFRPTEVWEGVDVPLDALRQELVRAASEVGSAWRTIQRGDRLTVGGAEVIVWHPLPAEWERRRVRNDDSVVLEVRFGDVSVLMSGDIEASAEAEVGPLIGPAVIRVAQSPHHGSATSATDDWLDRVAPRAVVMSAGRGNRYGHPHAAVLARLRRRHLPVFRTDQDGAVTLDTDGRSVSVTTFSGRSWEMGPASEHGRRPVR